MHGHGRMLWVIEKQQSRIRNQSIRQHVNGRSRQIRMHNYGRDRVRAHGSGASLLQLGCFMPTQCPVLQSSGGTTAARERARCAPRTLSALCTTDWKCKCK